MGLAKSEMKVQNEVLVNEPAIFLANKRVQMVRSTTYVAIQTAL